MSFASFIAGRITFKSKRTFSKLIVRIAIIGIMLGLGVMILSLAVVSGFKREIREKVRGFDGDMKVIKYDLNSSFENSPFVRDTLTEQKLRNASSVEYMVPYATKAGIVKFSDEIEGVILKGVDKTYNWRFIKSCLVEGNVINFADSIAARQQLMVSQTTANRLRLKVGDKVIIYFVQEPPRPRPFKIVGIYDTSIQEVDKTYVIGDLSVIQKLNDQQPDVIGGYELRIKNFDRLDTVADQVNSSLPIKLRLTTIKENYSNIFDWLQILDVNAQVMLVLMLLVAVINMISALLIMILERTSMIGIMKAMGTTNWAIQKIFLYNASYLISIGLLLGNILGVGLGLFQYYTHFFKLDASSYYMTFIPVEIKFTDVVLLNIGTMAVCLLVLIIPSMLISRITPVKAIRFK
ncbi:ABC transporter permease [Mucilaginibacter calamicampi]|uniref:ABC transporter permease n=1 Tax=Mucilaginibacter calamicampi TaxID=1302352 RepID=A0ABW2YQX6_9SPHI